MERVRVGGFDTVTATRRELAEQMVRDCSRRTPATLPKLVFSSNGQGIALAGSDRDFARIMGEADIIHADGQSVVIASKLLTKTPIRERCATTDFFHDAARAAEEAGLSFFIFGGTEARNAGAVDAIRSLYPKLTIAGRCNGYFPPEQNDEICAKIRHSRADVLWVGLGKPSEQYWCFQNRDKLAGVGWMKTCGGLYAFLVGETPRAPAWMQNIGLEWLYRTIQEPRRLAWRYFATNPAAVYRILRLTGATRDR